MSRYRLQFLDPSRKFVRADRIEGDCDADAIDIAQYRRLPVRSELWDGARLVAKFPPREARTASAGRRPALHRVNSR
jgi:hypothetical protein